MLTPEQVRMARAALKIGVRDLAAMASVTPATISRFEMKKGGMHANTMDAVQKALEAAGVVFIDDGTASADGGPGGRVK